MALLLRKHRPFHFSLRRLQRRIILSNFRSELNSFETAHLIVKGPENNEKVKLIPFPFSAGLLDSFGEGHKSSDWRRARANSLADWSSSLLPPGPCFSNQGRLGRCTTFRQCYPYFKLPDLSNWETWVLGVYDTCSYFNDDGRQV